MLPPTIFCQTVSGGQKVKFRIIYLSLLPFDMHRDTRDAGNILLCPPLQPHLRQYQKKDLDKILDVVDLWTAQLVPKSTFFENSAKNLVEKYFDKIELLALYLR